MSTSNRVPKAIGSYEVVRALGKGGMGEVFLARHDLLERQVAVKRLVAKEDADLEELEERFLREGRALSSLHHQGIVGVFDLFRRRGTLYLVLEYVDGPNVAQILEEGALPLDVAAIVGLRVAEALECAHRRGIIHRDIKASNVMASRSGEVKLMDFGIARDQTLEQMTSTGIVVGTPMYVAPEVVQGAAADPRSDVYALGALLYHALSGRRLFEHATKENLFALIVAGKFPRLGKVAPHVPGRLQRVVMRCLAKKPEQRFQTAAELRQSLELFLADTGVWANHEERVVGFLRARGHLSEAEASAWLSASDLVISTTFTRPGRVGWRHVLLWLVLAGAAAAGVFWLTGTTGWGPG